MSHLLGKLWRIAFSKVTVIKAVARKGIQVLKQNSGKNRSKVIVFLDIEDHAQYAVIGKAVVTMPNY